MSTYTTEVRFICETAAGYENSVGFSRVNDVIRDAQPKIFDFPYPIFDENYRDVLERKILLHFYTREICCETVGLWKLYLQRRLQEIMPYYNQLYESQLLKFDPLLSDNYKRYGDRKGTMNRADVENIGDQTDSHRGSETNTEQHSRNQWQDSATTTSNGNTTGQHGTDNTTSGTTNQKTTTSNQGTTDSTGTRTNTQTNAYQDTPQGALEDVSKLRYLTDYRVINDNEKTTGHVETKDSGTTNVTGDTGGTSKETGTRAEQRQDNSKTDRNGTSTDDVTGKSTTEENADQTYKRERSYNAGQNDTENYMETVIGYRGRSATSLLLEFRDSFLNIDEMILRELEPLFMGLWF